MEAIHLRKESIDNETTIFVKGILDFSTMDSFIKEIKIIDAGTEKVIINFSELTFIDSTGIGAIINLVHEATSKQFTVALEGVTEETKVIFETIGVFEILKSLQKEVD